MQLKHKHLFVIPILISLSVLFIACSCKQTATENKETGTEQKKASNDTVCFLDYGMIPPPFYDNAKEMIGHLFHIKYMRVAGCEVSQNLIDSVNKEDKKAIEKLAKRNPALHIDSLNNFIEREYHSLQRIDSVLRKSKVLKNDGYIYYTKANHIYNAYCFTFKNKGFNINEIVKIDSASFKIIENKTFKTDSLIIDLKNLHGKLN